MSWLDEVDELKRRRRIARTQGGKEGIAKQHARGRLTIRERIDALLDPGSFQEHGKATAIPEYDDDDQLFFTPTTAVSVAASSTFFFSHNLLLGIEQVIQ